MSLFGINAFILAIFCVSLHIHLNIFIFKMNSKTVCERKQIEPQRSKFYAKLKIKQMQLYCLSLPHAQCILHTPSAQNSCKAAFINVSRTYGQFHAVVFISISGSAIAQKLQNGKFYNVFAPFFFRSKATNKQQNKKKTF